MIFYKNFKYQHMLRLANEFSKFTRSKSSSSTFTTSANPNIQARKPSILKNYSETLFGQPTPWTHPHLLSEYELVPGVRMEEFQHRRFTLMTNIQKYTREQTQSGSQSTRCHLVLIPSSTKKYMSDKIPYVFRQNSDFFYYTGCLEPDTVLMLTINEHEEVKSVLFMRPKDKHAELWDGPRTGVDNAVELFGVDEAFSTDDFEEELDRRIAKYSKPLMWYDTLNSNLPSVTNDLRQVVGAIPVINSPTNFMQNMRLIKSPAEQNLMRRTCQIASNAINEVMLETRPGHTEHQLFAMVDYKCRMNNANYLAYPPVVATGTNGTIIHYINNTQRTKSGDLVLMDAGCEYGGYTSDITRTWPVNGEFTKPQKILYDVILQLQKDLINTLLKEGGQTLDHLFDTMCIKLGKYLQEVGLVPKDITYEQSYAKAGYQFCPHHVSHYLGMDVHDTPLMSRSIALRPGMVCTVEPGIYIGVDRLDVPKEFRGLGIRIEDDILINGENKVEVLTASCRKERTELETMFKEKR